MDKTEVQEMLSAAIYTAGRDLIKKVALWLAFGYFAVVAIDWIAGNNARDSTDGAERSGMKLHSDAKTGCQYLSAPGAGITPRITADGRHYGCRNL